MHVEIRKNRVKGPNRRPPSIDFLKQSKQKITDDNDDEEETEIEIDSTLIEPLSDQSLLKINPPIYSETMLPKTSAKETPPWLLELKKRKKKEEAPNPAEISNNCEILQTQNDVVISEIRDDSPLEQKSGGISVSSSAKYLRILRNKPNKPPEAKPTLLELQKGAERINNTIAELQKDLQRLLDQIKQLQLDSNIEE